MKKQTLIKLPLKQILEDFKIKRQSFYALNKRHRVFHKEAFGYYSTTIQAYSEIKRNYENKRSSDLGWKHNTSGGE